MRKKWRCWTCQARVSKHRVVWQPWQGRVKNSPPWRSILTQVLIWYLPSHRGNLWRSQWKDGQLLTYSLARYFSLAWASGNKFPPWTRVIHLTPTSFSETIFHVVRDPLSTLSCQTHAESRSLVHDIARTHLHVSSRWWGSLFCMTLWIFKQHQCKKTFVDE